MQAVKRTSYTHRQRGFTLVEVCIGVAILALMMAVVIPSANNVSRADLRKSASAMSSIIKQTYDSAALTGQTWRIQMIPGKSEVKIESTVDVMSVNGNTGQVDTVEDELSGSLWGNPNEDLGGGDKKGKDSKDGKDSPDAGGGMFDMLSGAKSRGQHAAKAGFTAQGKVQLDSNVTIMDVWTDGLAAVVVQGETYLYFFPGGYTQDAMIHLQDSEKRVYTLKVQPLTGRVQILDNYVEAPVGR